MKITRNELQVRGLLLSVADVRCQKKNKQKKTVTVQCLQPPCMDTECVVPAAASVQRCRTVDLAFFPPKDSLQLCGNPNNSSPHQLHLNTSRNPSYNRFHVCFLCSYFTKLPWGSRQYLAACGRVGEESPRLTNGRQDADVTNAKKEEKSTRETQKQVQWYKWKKSAEA